MGLSPYSRRSFLTHSKFFVAPPLLSPLVNAIRTPWFGQGTATTDPHHAAPNNGDQRCVVVPLFREGVFIDVVDGDPTNDEPDSGWA